MPGAPENDAWNRGAPRLGRGATNAWGAWGAPGAPHQIVRLITAHRILIAAAIAFFLFYASVQLRRLAASGEMASLAQAAISLVVAGGLVLYYRGLAKRWNGRS